MDDGKSSEFVPNVKNIAMKTFYIVACAAALALGGCSAYRGAQTPDDVYYSSSPVVAGGGADRDDYAEANSSRRDGQRYQQRSTYNGYDDYATPDDRWLMMRVRDRARWSVFDDYNYYSPYNDFAYGGMGGYYGMDYGYGYPMYGYGFGSYYNPYSFGLGLGYGGFGYLNSYYNWNSFYNPYFHNVVVVNPKLNPAGYNTLRNFNLGGYTNRNYANSRTPARPNYNGYVPPSTSGNRVYNNRQYYTPNSGSGRRVYSNSTLNNGSSYDRPSRSYAPAYDNSNYSPRSSGASSGSSYSGGSSGSSGSSGGSSGGGRPRR